MKEVRRTTRIWIALAAAAVGPGSGSSASAPTTPPSPVDTQLVVSPDGHLQAAITIADDVRYALTLDGTPLVLSSPVSLSPADGRVLGRGARVVRVDRREISEEIPTPIGKRAKVKNACRELAILLSDGATLRARVFDDGFVLRWETALPGRIRVRDEGFSITFPGEPTMFSSAARVRTTGTKGSGGTSPSRRSPGRRRRPRCPWSSTCRAARSWASSRRTSTTTPRCTSRPAPATRAPSRPPSRAA